MANEGMTVVGIGQGSGEYEGHSYNNTYLHCLYVSDKVQGNATTKIKVQTSVYLDNPVKVGDIIDTNCDQFGKVKQIVVL